MKYYAALLAVLMVGIAVGQKKLEPPCTYSGVQISGSFETNCVPAPAPKKPPAKKHAAHKVSYFRQDCDSSGAICGPMRYVGPPPDVLDVPAIQETRKKCCVITTNGDTLLKYCPAQFVEEYKEWTCREKSRILQHDESTPAKYWCRKPQP